MNMHRGPNANILIVGGGLTGSVTARLLRHEVSANIEIWEKENHIGGRLYTFHDPSNSKTSADLGAQYISATMEFIRSHAKFYDELLDKEMLVPLGQKIENFRKLSESKVNFVAPEGTDTLVDHFLKKSVAKVILQHEVCEINLTNEKTWEVKAKNGVSKEFDAVVLTLPVPEVLKLKGNFQECAQTEAMKRSMEAVKSAMEQVKYSSRHAIAIMYNEPMKFFEELTWSMKFFPDDDMICFIAVDNRKRGKNDENSSLVIHTSTKFTQNNPDYTEDEVQEQIVEHLKCLIPGVPDPPLVKCIKWNYAQIIDAYIDNPGFAVLNESPCLICGGDSFTESNFNGCITSALKIVEELLRHVAMAKNLGPK